MINKRTVLILGAGASIPYGFPSGKQLKTEICMDLNDRGPYYDSDFEHELIVTFQENFYQSPQESIDAWLGKPGNRPFEEIGKYAIARVLLEYEREKSLFHDIVNSHGKSTARRPLKPKPCWYRQLYKAIDSSLADFHKNNLSVITFNYDRSLEHFIYTSLKSDNLDKSEPEIAKAAKSMEIVHVHGQLGYLPWQNKHVDTEVPFGRLGGGNYEIFRAVEHIKIIHEASESDSEFERARELLSQAERVYIIGFGYDETNLKRLGLNNMISGNLKHIEGTTLKISRRQQHNILTYLDEVATRAYISFHRHDQTAYDFLYKTVLLE